MYKLNEFISKHPATATICLIIVLFVAVAILVRYQRVRKVRKAKERAQNLSLEDFRKMYSQYEAIVEGEVKEIGNYAREYFCENWLEEFHEYFYLALFWLPNKTFTDFHMAAVMFFALTPENASIYQVRFAYDCVRNMISAPKRYVRHTLSPYETELEIEKTFDEVDFSIIEKRVTPDEICKIIKEVYLPNKGGKSLVELANFLERLYEQC